MNHHDVILTMRYPLVLFHGDCMDGFGSAWAAHELFGDGAEYVPAVYGRGELPDVAGRDVLILDYSYPRAVLLNMTARARSLVLLDHHKTAEADLQGLDFALFDMNRSGAGIAWDTIHSPDSRPNLIQYVEDRDLWKFQLPNSKAINAWIGCVEQTFDEWDHLAGLLDGYGYSVAERGAAILRKIDCYVRDMVKQARVCTFAGHPGVPVVNAPYINTSELVGELAKSAPFAVGWFQDGDGKYRYSLRSCGEFDVSALAKTFGGGGHRQAAGFTSDLQVTT